MMKLLKWALALIAVFCAIVAGLFFFYLYAPTPEQPPLAGQFHRQNLYVDGLQRSFGYYLPEPGISSPGVVFVLHGSGDSGDGIRRSTAYEFDTLADKHGFLVVYPDGYQNHWNDCRKSADYAANTDDVDDPAFIAAMTDFFQREHGADPESVFATGHSNGGHMAHRLALESPGLVAGIAAISANLPVAENLDCTESGVAVSVAIFSGTTDPINPYEGGLVKLFGNSSRGAVRSARETADYWSGLAGVWGAPAESRSWEEDGDPVTRVERQRWQGENGIAIELYTLHGSGHVIPSRLTRNARAFGGDARDVSGAELIVEFFLGD